MGESSRFDTVYSANQRGFTLIEMILVIVILGIAGVIAVVSMYALSGVGTGRDYTVNAQLAQQRLELILAEKRLNGFPESGSGPDPCEIYDLDMEVCDVVVQLEGIDDNGDSFGADSCNTGNALKYCRVTVTVDGHDFFMRLYNYAVQ